MPPDERAERIGRIAQLDALRATVVACRACARLVAWREAVAQTPRAAFAGQDYWARPLPGFGDPAARLLLVGLAPAAHGGNRTGRMFTGDRSGEFLFAALWRAGYASAPDSTAADDGLVLSDAYVTAAVRCAPPGNAPRPEEAAACAPFLATEVDLLGDVEVVLALGAYAMRALWRLPGLAPAPRAALPRFAHGLEVPLAPRAGRPRTLLGAFHPSQRNVFTGKLTPVMLDAVLARARALTGGATSSGRAPR